MKYTSTDPEKHITKHKVYLAVKQIQIRYK